MADDPNELLSTVDRGDTQKRVDITALHLQEFAVGAGTADDVLPNLTPVAFNTALALWAPWDANGANGLDTVKGFLWKPGEEHTLSATLVTQCLVIMAGKLHYDDVLAAVEARAVEVAADLATELKDGPRGIGLLVYGLPGVR